MPEEELNQEAVAEEEQGLDEEKIAAIIQDLLDQGASAEQVLEIIAQAVESGDLPPEAQQVAEQVLAADEEEGRRLFGLDE